MIPVGLGSCAESVLCSEGQLSKQVFWCLVFELSTSSAGSHFHWIDEKNKNRNVLVMSMSKLRHLAGPRCLALSAVSAHATLDARIEFDPIHLEKETSVPSLALDDE